MGVPFHDGNEKYDMEKKQFEAIETTRDLIAEFKIVVQQFIDASENQTKITEESNKTMKNWTKAIGWMTLAMALFTAATLYFTYMTYIN